MPNLRSPLALYRSLNERRWFRWLSTFAVYAAIFAAITAYQTADHLPSGQPVPDFSLTALDGTRTTSRDLRGQPTVIFFWAPWCSVCRADAHVIDSLHDAVGDEVHVLSIALSYRSREDVEAFAAEHGIVDTPVLLGLRPTEEAFAIEAFPTVYILDAEGRVTSTVVGYTTELGLRARLMLQGVL